MAATRCSAVGLRFKANTALQSQANITMKTLEEQLNTAGLVVSGHCGRLSTYNATLLSTSPLLMDMTPQEVDMLGQTMLMVRVKAGQALIREGEVGEWMLLLLKGTVDVTKRIEPRADEGGEKDNDNDNQSVTQSRIAVLQCGAAVGEMSMLDSEPRFASCTAIEDVEAGVLGRREIALLIRDHPAVGAKLLVKITQIMAQRLRNTSNQLIKLLQKS